MTKHIIRNPAPHYKKTPHYKRLMVFVDGTNLLIEMSKKISIPFRAEKPPFAAIDLAHHIVNSVYKNGKGFVKIRRYWFSSYRADDKYYNELCKYLRKFDFEPVLFKKRKGKEKGVDIALTMEMLINAFNQNFDVGLLIAGDDDYFGLINEVKRYGPIIMGAFFENGLSKRLPIAFDDFQNLDEYFNDDRFNTYKQKIKNQVSS